MLATYILIAALIGAEPTQSSVGLPGFRKSAWFEEQVREEWIAEGVRVIANAQDRLDPQKPTRLIIYATPNGNTIEQTLGCTKADGLDWHFDIQHVVAQIRRLRELSPSENVVLACVEVPIETIRLGATERLLDRVAVRRRLVVEQSTGARLHAHRRKAPKFGQGPARRGWLGEAAGSSTGCC